MKIARAVAACLLVFVAILALAADVLTPHDPSLQFRDHVAEAPSRTFLLGTDELGRDRFSRLLYGIRVSLICAPAAALVATLLGATAGLLTGFNGGWIDEFGSAGTDLLLSLPWLFTFLTARALLPLNVSPWASLTLIFLLLAATCWAPGARVVRASVAEMRVSAPLVYARSYGCKPSRMLWLHLLSNLRPVLTAQFWVLVPTFLLAEANLGILGLGITEPTPSWGNLLSELRDYERIPEAPWMLAPALLLALFVASLHLVMSGRKRWD